MQASHEHNKEGGGGPIGGENKTFGSLVDALDVIGGGGVGEVDVDCKVRLRPEQFVESDIDCVGGGVDGILWIVLCKAGTFSDSIRMP